MNNIVLLKQKKSALNEDSDVGGVVAEWLARSTLANPQKLISLSLA